MDTPERSSQPAPISAVRSGGSVAKAFAWMAGALASFSIIAVAGREAGRSIDTMQIMFFRSVIALTLVLAAASLAGYRPWHVRTTRLSLHTLRSVIHFGAQYCWLHALTLIPLAQLFALEFTSPLWVALLAPSILGERLTFVRLSAALIGFAGLSIVVQPGAQALNFGTVLGLLAAVGFAFSMIFTKQLIRTDSILTILVYMSAIQAVMGFLPVLPRLAIPDAKTAMWVFLIGACGLTAHYALTRAIAEADAIIVAPMDFLRLPLIALVGVLIYAEPLDPLILLGGAVVIAANFLNLWGERR